MDISHELTYWGSEGNYRRVKDNKNASYSYFIGVSNPSCNEVNTRVYANCFIIIEW